MTMNNDQTYLKRCLSLAKNGFGRVAPNPMVGCVIVYNDTIIGEGFHQQYGKAHAEVNAINSVKNKDLLTKSTLYVNLEPCAHHGKTPPCSDLIIAHKIPKVVIGCIDTFSEVAGKGIEKLQQAGVEVTVGILEKEAIELNQRFFTFHTKKRPYIVLKWAQTKDGFIDIDRSEKESKDNWITTGISKQLVHKWRTEEQAIMVGTNTALNDNPQLTAREWSGNNPLRMVLDLDLRLPNHLHLFDKNTPTLVFTYGMEKSTPNLEYIQLKKNNDLLTEIMNVLYQKNIQSIIIEGGASFLNSFIAANLWDEARVLTGDKYFEKGLKAPTLHKTPYTEDQLSTDLISYYTNH